MLAEYQEAHNSSTKVVIGTALTSPVRTHGMISANTISLNAAGSAQNCAKPPVRPDCGVT